MVTLNALPDGYLECKFCGWGYRHDNDPSARCSKCGMLPQPVTPPKTKTPTTTHRRAAPKITPLEITQTGNLVWGVDPGARYTAVVLRDGTDVLHASTLTRDLETTATNWALEVVTSLQTILNTAPDAPIAVEGISDPKGFKHGARQAINPKDIIRAGIVLGAIVAIHPTATIIPPGSNGSQHATHYPECLKGRRPLGLPGVNKAGTRKHEQSAYDVAGKAAQILYDTKVAVLPERW